jgi:hypothetical protein
MLTGAGRAESLTDVKRAQLDVTHSTHTHTHTHMYTYIYPSFCLGDLATRLSRLSLTALLSWLFV